MLSRMLLVRSSPRRMARSATPPLRDVPRDDHHAIGPAVAPEDGCDGVLEQPLLALRRAEGDLTAGGQAGPEDLLTLGVERLHDLGGQAQLPPVLAPHCGGIEAQRPGTPVADGHVAALPVHEIDVVHRGGEDARQELGLSPDFRLGPLPLADISEDQDGPDDPPGRVPDRGRTVVDGPLGAVPGDQDGVVGQADDGPLPQRPEGGVLDLQAGPLVDDTEDRGEGLARRLGRGPARERLGDRVQRRDPALGVGDEDGIADAGEGDPQLLPLPDGLLGVRLGPPPCVPQAPPSRAMPRPIVR